MWGGVWRRRRHGSLPVCLVMMRGTLHRRLEKTVLRWRSWARGAIRSDWPRREKLPDRTDCMASPRVRAPANQPRGSSMVSLHSVWLHSLVTGFFAPGVERGGVLVTPSDAGATALLAGVEPLRAGGALRERMMRRRASMSSVVETGGTGLIVRMSCTLNGESPCSKPRTRSRQGTLPRRKSTHRGAKRESKRVSISRIRARPRAHRPQVFGSVFSATH
jgi:hypothetical protein